MFGFGLFRDLFRIPDYVRQANGKPEHEDFQKDYMKLTGTPPVHGSHVLAMFIVGTWYYYCVGAMASFIFPQKYIVLAYVLGSAAMSLGVWFVGSSGREACSLRHILYAVLFVSAVCSGLQLAALLPTLPAAVGAAIWTRRWRRDRRERALSFGASVAILIVVSAFMITATFFAVKWSIDEEIFIKGQDGNWNLNHEEAGQRFKQGFEDTFGGFGDLSGFSGGGMSVGAARKLLNVKPGATDDEITRAFRKMSVQWHPDKYKGDPKEALDMQTKLNEAREVLSSKKKRRNSRDVEAEVREERAEAKRERERKRAARKEEEAQERMFKNRGEGVYAGGKRKTTKSGSGGGGGSDSGSGSGSGGDGESTGGGEGSKESKGSKGKSGSKKKKKKKKSGSKGSKGSSGPGGSSGFRDTF